MKERKEVIKLMKGAKKESDKVWRKREGERVWKDISIPLMD